MKLQETEFSIGQRIKVDGLEGGVITSISFRSGGLVPLLSTLITTYEVSWIVNGDAKSVWLDEWRLSE